MRRLVRLLDAWERWWCAPTPLTRLAAFRIIVLALALYEVEINALLVHADAQGSSAGGRVWQPLLFMQALGLGPVGPALAGIEHQALRVVLALGILGVGTRVACLLAALLWFHWSGLAYSFGKPHHEKVVLAFALAALPLAPVGRRLSVDALVARWRAVARPGSDPFAPLPWQAPLANLPLRMAQVSAALGYAFAGWSKLLIGGPAWLNGFTLQGILLGHDADWSAPMSQSVGAAQLMSIGLVGVQATFPLVLLWPKLAWFYLPAATLQHLATWKAMDTGPYMTLWLMLVCFVPLERVPAALRHWWGAVPLAAVGALVGYIAFHVFSPWLCLLLVPLLLAAALRMTDRARVVMAVDSARTAGRRAAVVCRWLDWAGRVEVLDLCDETALRVRAPELAACSGNQLHVITASGRVVSGFAACQALARRLPLPLLLAWPLALPPLHALGARVHARLAGVPLDARAQAIRPPDGD